MAQALTVDSLIYQNLDFGDKFQGSTNYETWNISLWIDNDDDIRKLAIKSISFFDFVLKYFNTFYEMQTNDGISFFDYRVNVDELDEKIKELRLEDYWNTIN